MISGLIDQSQGDLAARIKTARKEARLSQLALANRIGLSDKSISAYEQGRSAPPFSKLNRLRKLQITLFRILQMLLQIMKRLTLSFSVLNGNC